MPELVKINSNTTKEDENPRSWNISDLDKNRDSVLSRDDSLYDSSHQLAQQKDMKGKSGKNQEDEKKSCIVVPNTNLVDGVAADKKPKKKLDGKQSSGRNV